MSNGWNLVIACVGKPSAGKSTFFNAVTDGSAKTGAFPFTTIEPNVSFTYYLDKCPCSSHNVAEFCSPKYGKCVDGIRNIPVKLLDVAGLIPGASKGLGLGNQFLNDLCQAQVLLHVVDVSGTTNEKGEVACGYDPINDVEWLQNELHDWVFNNIWNHWDNITRKHTALMRNGSGHSSALTIHRQLSGYSVRMPLIQTLMYKKLSLKEPVDLSTWDEKAVHRLVEEFLRLRFPTILVLNKSESGGDADRNIERISDKYDPLGTHSVVASALAEVFLKGAVEKNFIYYPRGAKTFLTKESEFGWPDNPKANLIRNSLRPLGPKIRKRLEKVEDMITGVWNAVQMAIECAKPIVCYPVANVNTFNSVSTMNFHSQETQHANPNPKTIDSEPNKILTSDIVPITTTTIAMDSPVTVQKKRQCFRDCFLFPPGAKIKDFKRLLFKNLNSEDTEENVISRLLLE